jgi:F0F1-type ATP synthase beta subunit
MANIGHVKQVIGPVVDVSFSTEGSKLPEILNALEISRGDNSPLVLEVQQHLVKIVFVLSLWTLQMVNSWCRSSGYRRSNCNAYW